MIRSATLLAAAIALLSPTAAQAQPSKAGAYVAKEQMVEACGSRKGAKAAKDAFQEKDLTGDGRADLLVNHSKVRCTAKRKNERCGPKNCTIQIYVRTKRGLLKPAFETLAREAKIGDGDKPAIIITSSLGTGKVRWDGKTFSQ
ncbi:MAG: hypothetical protein AAF764_04620 [Pseudomonadota bacterium]